ncbi:MAG: family ATPase, partial [Candidatus Thermoplasmatota archaeon]|nr:family ATPase [Candidatus Thermoplasmatota archaeon]
FPDGVVGIIGLNGSGKTTLVEGVAWALFGNTEEAVRTSRESIKRAGAGPSETSKAVLEFELGGSDYRVEREMGGKNLLMKASLRTGSTVLAEGDKDVKREVEKLIGMDHKSFFTSVFARQKELSALQNSTDAERKKAVLRMLRIDGIDDVIKRIREDKRDVEQNIKGVGATLLDEQGRDREAVISAQMPGLRSAFEGAEALLEAAKVAEAAAAKSFQEALDRRNALKKDAEAYGTTVAELQGKTSRMAELEQRTIKLDKQVADARARLAQLPELEAADKAWAEAAASVERLEKERLKDERAKHLAEDLRADRESSDARRKDLEEADKAAAGAEDLEAQRSSVERSREEVESARAAISDKQGEQRTRKADREKAAAKDRVKLEEIRRLGKEGVCPTCERRLDEAYDLLAAKLQKDIDEATAAASEAGTALAALQNELESLKRKDEAVKKKASRIELESDKRKKAEATAQSIRQQLTQLDARTAKKSGELSSLGAIEFSKEAYDGARAERDRLKPRHDDFVRLKEAEKDLAHKEAERGEVMERRTTLGLEVESLSRMKAELEPKKALHEKMSKDVDEKTAIRDKAKDEAHSKSTKCDEAKNALRAKEKDLEDIERVKKSIESARRKVDDLASLEEVMVSFKDHLMSKVAPTLADLTSHMFAATTGGRYTRVELGDSYDIQVDDEGALHPLKRFSGGESDLANLALRLAISRIIAERTGANPINFLILDEIFGSLDPDRKRSVMTALTALSAQFRQIFLITHIDDIKDLMGNVVRVELTEDGTSTAVLV